MSIFYRALFCGLMAAFLLIGCGVTPPPTATGLPPDATYTIGPPTATELPPDATRLPPDATYTIGPPTITLVSPAPTPVPLGEMLSSGAEVIAFLSYAADYSASTIYAMQSDGSSLQTIPNTTSAATLSWAPGGERFAYTIHHGDAAWSMYAVDADGRNRQRLSERTVDYVPAWSPDGTRLAFVRDCGLWVARISDTPPLALSDLRQLTAEPQECVWTLSWSPDGQQIAFSAQSGTAHGNADYDDPLSAEIYVIQADGTNRRRLTDNHCVESGVSWSPDGQRLVFASTRDRDLSYTLKDAFAAQGEGAFQIYVMDADGQNVQRLTHTVANDVFPAWSPDGKQIAFSSDRDGNAEIYVMHAVGMHADGSMQTRLTDSPRYDSYPVWKTTGAAPSAAVPVAEVPLATALPVPVPPAAADAGVVMGTLTFPQEAAPAARNAAQVCRRAGIIGTLERGKFADVLVVDGDPVQDLQVLKEARMVVHGGVIIK